MKVESDLIIAWFWAIVAAGVLLFGAGVFVFGIGVLGHQTLLWLQNGYWSPLEFRLAWQWVGGSEPSFAWVGVQKIMVAADTPTRPPHCLRRREVEPAPVIDREWEEASVGVTRSRRAKARG